MGMVYAEITLKSIRDEGFAREGYIKPEDIRAVTVTAVADSGSLNLVITEELRNKLGLQITEEKFAQIANGERVTCKRTDAVRVQWKNRSTILQPMVIPGAKQVLFGAMALEGMDLMVNPVAQEVVGIHGDEEEYYALAC